MGSPRRKTRGEESRGYRKSGNRSRKAIHLDQKPLLANEQRLEKRSSQRI
jgi:hypothetical protein